MKRPLVALLFLGLAVYGAGCTSTPTGDHAAIATTEGCIIVELYPDDAPQTVSNFLQYAEDDFYEGTIFHRIYPGFVIQGGGFTEDGTKKDTRAPIPLEAKRSNTAMTLSMARTGDPNSATSQFYVNLKDNSASLDPTAEQDGYAVFGKVIEGEEVVQAIAAHPQSGSTPSGPLGFENWPEDPAPKILDVSEGTECQGDFPSPTPVVPEYGVEAGFLQDNMTNGTWYTTISAATDYAPFWVLNKGNVEDSFVTQVVAPESWNVSVAEGTYTLSKDTGGEGSSPYGYATVGRLVIKHVDLANATDANVTLTFRSVNDPDAKTTLSLRLVVDDRTYTRVSTPGEEVRIGYEGSFDDGEVFDSGSFSTVVASQETVPGFSNGMMGIHIGEVVDIRFPPELGYGYNTSGSYAKFDGEWLNFEITLQRLG